MMRPLLSWATTGAATICRACAGLPRDPADHDGESVVWLIGGETHDVDEFVDAIEGAGDNVQTGEYADVIDIDRGAEARKAIFGV